MENPELILQESKILYAKQAIFLEDERMEAVVKRSFNDMLKFLNRSEKKNLYDIGNPVSADLIQELQDDFLGIFKSK